jgi:hypothetical protein
MPNSKQQTAKEILEEAFASATAAFAKDMPLIMHGSGGDEDNPAAQRLVAALTVSYCQELVEAALDAWDMQQPPSDEFPPPPPPPFQRSSQPTQKSAPLSSGSTTGKRKADTLWDDPLPTPRIRGQAQSDESLEGKEVSWVGAAGIDLWEHTRARAAYVRGISAQQFVFPICHDTYVYGRIREMQAAMGNLTDPLLHDATVMDAVRAEGEWQHEQLAVQKRRRQRKTTKPKPKKDDMDKKENGNTSDPEDDDDPDEEEVDDTEELGASWPCIENLLPAHRSVL